MKRERIELAIECQSRIGKHGGPIRLSEEELSIRKNYYLKLRELNKKGI
jgi:hypothetical protein